MHFNIFGKFQKNEYFLVYENFVDIFWGHHKTGLYLGVIFMHFSMDHKITWISFLSILSISLPMRESGIRRDKYLSAAIFKKAVHSDDP